MTAALRQKIILGLLLAGIFALNYIGLQHKGLTYDESHHFKYGLSVLNGNTDRFDDSKMPFSAINAIPHKIWEALKNTPLQKPFKKLEKERTGRWFTVFFSILVGFYVYRWASELYGITAGLWALFFYAFEPNILAHSRLVTTDAYCMGMIFISLYHFRKYLTEGGLKNQTLSALTLGLAQLAKFTCIFLYPLFLVIAFLFHIKNLKSQFKPFLKSLLLFMLINLFIINAGYLFNRTFTPLEKYEFKSRIFQTLQDKSGSLSKLPLPFPAPFMEGLDWVKYNEESGKGFGLFYLLGKTNRSEGFKGYFLIASLYKIPVAMLIFILLGVLSYIRKFKLGAFLGEGLFLWIPILFFTIYFNFLFKAHAGMRFFIVVLPFLYVVISALFENWNSLSKTVRGIYSLLSVYYVLSVLSYTPHYLSYFNEFIGDRKNAYKFLADSNIDWGENSWYLDQYLKKHPGAIVNPETPVSGQIIVNVNQLAGVTDGPEKYAWLRNHFKPAGHIAYSYLIFNVPPEDLKKVS